MALQLRALAALRGPRFNLGPTWQLTTVTPVMGDLTPSHRHTCTDTHKNKK